ncbi:complex I NDUFA9 subunit family protein [Chelatococcus sp. SYSU_G07232]|uniref:Complex I NDUFA9 subunit family protein n=1 Tax=Chelatococcus albus TaxID=3047466 RepID=A0ABT7AHE2_9HYPH|nr:complex I NDUFA9 subunit family protein [Chelatococcus sp. SYSU_G07232]MDJ1158779.1 complex I NDUFA9 subunit family protein [Chelatococcus sp. SYSU_G07232]
MSAGALSPSSQLVTVFGGSGFIGRHVVRALAKRGYRIRVAVRRPDLAGHLQPLGRVGQIHAVQANLRYKTSVEQAVAGAAIVVNLVGILQETGRQTFEAVQAFGARAVAQAAAAAGARLVHVSALGADDASDSAYARTKAEAEKAVFAALPQAVVFRPSIVFGPEDQFYNRFAALARMMPVLPLAGADTKFQPVFVGDVAEAIARAVDGAVAGGRIYELGGPEVRTLRGLVEYVLKVTHRKRLILPLPFGAAHLQATVVEFLDKLTLGLMPDEFVITRDQVKLLRRDNVVSEAAVREGRTLEGLGITPNADEAIVPSYLWRFRKAGQFDTARTI